MKKLLALLAVFCMLSGAVPVHADQYQEAKAIGLCDFQTVRFPEPEGEVDPNSVYFTQEFTFVPEEDGSYLFVAADMDEPYDFTLDVVGLTGCFPLKYGCAFEGVAGETYTLRFQYPSYDGRNPEFTLYIIEEFNHNYRDTLALGETKTFTIPQPEQEIEEGWTYFNLSLFFTPEEDGTYRFLVSFEEDKSEPYDYYMAVTCPDGYWELENGCQFDAQAGETYELFFQYPNHDGRYPEFTFYVEEGAAPVVPGPVVTEPATETVHTEPIAEPSEAPATVTETEDAGTSMPDMKTLLMCAGAAAAVIGAVVLLIAERKKNMNPDPL